MNSLVPGARGVLVVVHIILAFVLLIFTLDSRAFPYADEWVYTAPLDFTTYQEYFSWIFRQHADHRIPIQNAVQFALVNYSLFDFRILVTFNIFMAVLLSIVLCAIAFISRGAQRYGDIFIPLCILTPGAMYALWGFQFAFLSSVFFASVAVFLLLLYLRRKQDHCYFFSLLPLSATALCALNGAILATVLTSAVAAVVAQRAWSEGRFPTAKALALVLPVGVTIAVWASWMPSAASDMQTDVFRLVPIVFKLLAAHMVVFALSETWLKSGFVAAVALVAAYAVLRAMRRGELAVSDVLLGALIAGSVLVILSVALARSKFMEGWSPVMSMHYSVLTIFVPIISWILLSTHLRSVIATIIGVALVLFYAESYRNNYVWRANHAASVFDLEREIDRALREATDIPAMVDRFALQLTWRDDAEAKQMVIDGITRLRDREYPRYRHVPAVPPVAHPAEGAAGR